MTSKAVLMNLRKLCASLPQTLEGRHSDAIAFKAGTRMFATYRASGQDSELVFGLEPEHATALVETDPRFDRYPRAAHAVRVHGSDIRAWSEIRALILESHSLVAPKNTSKKAMTASRKRK
jgi:predicted DNA-binding protein (MmcQ/YjbR family)